jgi:copper(I)-binding protein
MEIDMIRSFTRAARLAVVLTATLLPGAAFAEDMMLGDLTLSGAFTRAMAPTAKVGGGFITITNNGQEDDRLISASSPAAPVVQLHEMAVVDDVMKMRELPDGIEIPAGETVTLKPGGLHIMFMQVPTPFEEGSEVPVTLTFEKAGSVDVMLHVGALGASTPMNHGS